ncbi:hypothetical protein HDF16_002308 [Granulicella aggregans]|uniref:Uncharacterized protein n=1 Tax=Granulicella aggregans TaxID=474949 RepID=A0A7W8E3I0_9BACT|nr:hypothetical protein [Granulicella aggregans]MBB5057602.1 hypothetical protein [Granulicella aggregans]
MSFSISAISSNDATLDTAPQAKQAPKVSVADEIKQLADQGRSAQTIATTVGLPETLVAVELGTTTTTSSTTSQAGALLALGARLSVHA